MAGFFCFLSIKAKSLRLRLSWMHVLPSFGSSSSFGAWRSVLGCLWLWRFHFSQCDKRFFNLALHRASLPVWPQCHHLILLLFSSFISWLARANSMLLNFCEGVSERHPVAKTKENWKRIENLAFCPLETRDARLETRDSSALAGIGEFHKHLTDCLGVRVPCRALPSPASGCLIFWFEIHLGFSSPRPALRRVLLQAKTLELENKLSVRAVIVNYVMGLS